MKTVRLLLLVLLAALLPWRGALAGGLHCAGGGMGSGTVAATQHGSGMHASAHGSHALPSGTQLGGPQADVHAGADACKLCSVCCGSPSLPAAALPVLQALAGAASAYPALTAPAPSHPGEGQDRPPRRS